MCANSRSRLPFLCVFNLINNFLKQMKLTSSFSRASICVSFSSLLAKFVEVSVLDCVSKFVDDARAWAIVRIF